MIILQESGAGKVCDFSCARFLKRDCLLRIEFI